MSNSVKSRLPPIVQFLPLSRGKNAFERRSKTLDPAKMTLINKSGKVQNEHECEAS